MKPLRQFVKDAGGKEELVGLVAAAFLTPLLLGESRDNQLGAWYWLVFGMLFAAIYLGVRGIVLKLARKKY